MNQDRLTGLALHHVHDIPVDIDQVIEDCFNASTPNETSQHTLDVLCVKYHPDFLCNKLSSVRMHTNVPTIPTHLPHAAERTRARHRQ